MKCPWCDAAVTDPMTLPISERWDEHQCQACSGTYLLEQDAEGELYRVVGSCEPRSSSLSPESMAWYEQTQKNLRENLARGPRHIKVSLPGEPERWMVYDESC